MGCKVTTDWYLIPVVLVLFLSYIEVEASCGSKEIQCINSTSYQTCWYLFSVAQYDNEIYTCADGTTCDQENGDTYCIATTTTSITTTTTVSTTTTATSTTTPTTVTSTTTPTTVTTTTTPTTATTASTTSTTTTTTAPVTGPLTCNTNGQRWPAAACNQYYQCYLFLWNYYVVVQNCTTGQRYVNSSCVNDSTCVP